MANYQNGKVYSIRSPSTEMFYIGSTIQPLSKRFHEHKKKPNATNAKVILDFGDAYIELIHNYPCKTKEELTKNEGEQIRLNKGKCVNTRIEGRTNKEYRVDNKQKLQEGSKKWREANQQHIKDNHKEYYENNKEKCKIQKKQYNIINKDNISLLKKQYYIDNKDALKLRQKTDVFTCQCGSSLQSKQKPRHEKSKKHQEFITNN